jgi:hypothetical protein
MVMAMLVEYPFTHSRGRSKSASIILPEKDLLKASIEKISNTTSHVFCAWKLFQRPRMSHGIDYLFMKRRKCGMV